ncbi:MAG TPA: DUF2267 domain-containing protein [Gaiellaceae bacterium]|nr:DUF2267 domain-containing protein [Gaiellaceae bacterium]
MGKRPEVDYESFVASVEREAHASREEAERAIQATLRTLAERLTGGEARHVAAELPPRAAAWLRDGKKPQPFGFAEFLQRVAKREGVTEETAKEHAKAVFGALGRALDAKELSDMASELPNDFHELISAAHEAHEETIRAGAPQLGADEFVRRVAARAGLEFDDAVLALTAVLEAVGYRITKGEAEEIEAFLPRELHPPIDLGEAASGGAARRLTLEEFLDRIADIEGVRRDAARAHAHAVLVTLREALPEPEVHHLLSQLPDDYGSLLER